MLFDHFVRALGSSLETQVITYPLDQPLGYAELEALVRAALPEDQSYVLLAESFSGPIGIRIAADPPAGLTGIILCVTFAKNPYPLLGWAGPLAAALPVKSLPRWARAPFMWGALSPDAAPEEAARATAQVDEAVLRHRICAVLAVDETDALARIKVPALVLQASADFVVPDAASEYILRILPQAHHVEISGPHLLMQSRPAECAAAVTQFVRSL